MTLLHINMPPSFWYTTALMAGITVAYHLPPTPALALAGCGTLLMLWATLWIPITKKTAWLITIVTLGYTLAQVHHAHHQRLVHQFEKQTIDLQGVITSYAYTPHLSLPHRIMIQLKQCKGADGQWRKTASTQLMINTRENHRHLVGSTIQIDALTIPALKGDFINFCHRTNIVGSLYIPTLSVQLLSYPPYSWYRTIDQIHALLVTLFKKKLSRQTFTFFSALFLGNTDSIKKNLKSYHAHFQRWGIVHYLARSGLHLVIVTLALEYMVSLIPLSFMMQRTIVITSATMYWLCTWPTVSFYRALILFFMTNILMISRRFYHFLHLLFVVCGLFLLINPTHLFFLDFQLTFGLTALLALFNTSTSGHL